MSREPRIAYTAEDPLGAVALAKRIGTDPLVAQILIGRGYRDADSAAAFLSADEELDWRDYGEVESAAALIASHLGGGAPIAIHGDYDCDGVCSTAIIALGIDAVGGRAMPRVPERSDGYGLSMTAVDAVVESGARLLITVDCGITAVEEVERARSLGMDVIVIDHHRTRADGTLPEALIVHPEARSGSGMPICAAALARMVMQRLFEAMGRTDLPPAALELAALATVTDVMPLKSGNRSLVIEGLGEMRTTSNAGLRALIESAGIDVTRLSARDLGWAIGPRINAAGRVQSAAGALELLLADDRDAARRSAQLLEAANAERKLIQADVLLAARIAVGEQSESTAWTLSGEGWHPGVIGIVAGRLAREGSRPTAVLSIGGDRAVGSVRSVPGVDVSLALAKCEDLLLRYGGHAAAAGLTIEAGLIPEFGDRFSAAVSEMLPDGGYVEEVGVDAVVAPSEITLALLDEIERLAPFGEGNPEPVLAIPGAVPGDVRRMGDGRHARFSLALDHGSATAVAFNIPSEVKITEGACADFVGALERNRFRESEEARFVVRHVLQRSQDGPAGVLEYPSFVRMVEASVRDEVTIPGAAGGPARDGAHRSPEALLASLGRSGRSVVGVVSDRRFRTRLIAACVGQARVLSWEEAVVDPEVLTGSEIVLGIDPPPGARWVDRVASMTAGEFIAGWDLPGILFAGKANDRNRNLEPMLRPLYRELREWSSGRERPIERVLAGADGSRSPIAVGSALAIYREIGVLEFDLSGLEFDFRSVRADLSDSRRYAAERKRHSEVASFLSEAKARLS